MRDNELQRPAEHSRGVRTWSGHILSTGRLGVTSPSVCQKHTHFFPYSQIICFDRPPLPAPRGLPVLNLVSTHIGCCPLPRALASERHVPTICARITRDTFSPVPMHLGSCEAWLQWEAWQSTEPVQSRNVGRHSETLGWRPKHKPHLNPIYFQILKFTG